MSPDKTETVNSKCAEDTGSEKSEISNRSESSELMKVAQRQKYPYRLDQALG
jgi:hypothetical protein